jgi:hypothetical protein
VRNTSGFLKTLIGVGNKIRLRKPLVWGGVALGATVLVMVTLISVPFAQAIMLSGAALLVWSLGLMMLASERISMLLSLDPKLRTSFQTLDLLVSLAFALAWWFSPVVFAAIALDVV